MSLLRMSLPNELGEFRRINHALLEFLTDEGVPPDSVNRVRLVVEELVVNIIRHAFDDGAEHTIVLDVRTEPRRVQVTIEDDGKPFDPREAPEPVLRGPLEERRTSGYGIYIVKHMTRALEYARVTGKNRVRAIIEYGVSSKESP